MGCKNEDQSILLNILRESCPGKHLAQTIQLLTLGKTFDVDDDKHDKENDEMLNYLMSLTRGGLLVPTDSSM